MILKAQVDNNDLLFGLLALIVSQPVLFPLGLVLTSGGKAQAGRLGNPLLFGKSTEKKAGFLVVKFLI